MRQGNYPLLRHVRSRRMSSAEKATFADELHLTGRIARAGMGVARDRIAPRMARRSHDVPASVAQITPEWLSAVLFPNVPGAQVLDVRVSPGSTGTSTRAGPKLDFGVAWLAYRQHALSPFFAWAYTRAGAGALQPEFQADYVCNDIMTRTAHAVSDLESIDAVST